MSTECRTDRRRGDLRAARLNGVDAVEVGDDGRTLTVTFLGRAPHGVGPANIRIEGGRRITGIRAVEVTVETADDPELDDLMHVRVDRAGDTSRYRLCVVETDAYGRPGTRPYPGFDPRYHCAEFSFAQAGPTPYDCGSCEPAQEEYPAAPVIDYTARDFDSLRRTVLDRLSLTVPDWTERHAADLGVTLAELLAYTADQLSYHQDAVATEAYLGTARRRVSVRRHARLIDYPMHDGCNARAFVALETDRQITLSKGEFRFVAIDISRLDAQERPVLGTVIGEDDLAALSVRAGLTVFEPLPAADLTLRPQHNAVSLWTWGDEECVLPKGATAATLRDGQGGGRPRELKLRPGDIVILEEVLGPRTGTATGADPTHRQAVRLTSVTPLVDELYDQPVLEVGWAGEDALTFPLCLSARGGTDCALITDVSVARANVVLADHGSAPAGGAERFTVPPEPLAPLRCTGPDCGCPDGTDEGNTVTQAVHALLDQARAGRQLVADQVRELFELVGADAVGRAGLGIELAPGSPADERVQPPTADAQAAVLETLIAQLTYPAVPTRTRPLLHSVPVTQAAPYPDPACVAAGQAALLVAVPGRVRDRIEGLWRTVRDGAVLGESDVAELTVLFGPRILERVRLVERPAHALRELLARGDRLLAAKLERLAVLAARTRCGAVLDGYVVWEIAQGWGERYAAGLHPADPVLAGPAAAVARQDVRAALPAVRVTSAEGTWTPRRDLLAGGPRDRHVVGETENDGRLALRFGDGRHGAAPRAGSALEVTCRVGNGAAGNIGAEAVDHLVVATPGQGRARAGRKSAPDPAAHVTRVRNPLPAAGGTEPEDLDQVRQLAPLALTRGRLRAVTAEDYAELAGQVPGVQRAAAELRWTGTGEEVHVAVDPLGDGRADPALLTAVEHSLAAYRRIGHELVVRPALLVPVDVELAIRVAPGRQQGHVLARLRAVLGNRRLPDGSLGFFHPDALTFGEPVRVSRLVAVAAAVPGVIDVRVTRLRRQFGRDDGELAAGLLTIGRLEVAACDNDPDRPENGRLKLVIGGGR